MGPGLSWLHVSYSLVVHSRNRSATPLGRQSTVGRLLSVVLQHERVRNAFEAVIGYSLVDRPELTS